MARDERDDIWQPRVVPTRRCLGSPVGIVCHSLREYIISGRPVVAKPGERLTAPPRPSVPDP